MLSRAVFTFVPTTLTSLGIGGVGALAALAINLPLALLSGPALAVSIAALAGVHVGFSTRFRDASFVLVGIAIGSMVTRDTIAAMSQWPVAFGLMAIMLPIILLAGRWLLSRHFGDDPRTALLATSPGHLSFAIAFSDDLGLPVKRVAIIQAIRLLGLSLTVPIIAALAGFDVGTGNRSTQQSMSWIHLAALIAAVLALSPLATRIRLPAPHLLTGMFLSAGAHLVGWVDGRMHPMLAQALMLIIGTLIGTRFAGATFASLRAAIGAGLAAVFMTLTIAIGFAVPASMLTGIPLLDVMVAFSPGGLEAMIMIGIAIGADPGFVAAAHVARLLILSTIVPILLGRRPD